MTASTGLVEIPWEIAEREIVENPDFEFREAFYLVEINEQREIIYINDSGISWIRDNGIFANPNVNIKFVCNIDPEEIYKREIVREKMSVDNRASMTEVWKTVKYLHPWAMEILTTKFGLQARQEFLFDVIDAYKRAYSRPMLKIKREENKK